MLKAQTGASDDLGYREQFAEALVAAGCSLENARPGLIVAAARAAHESGLAAELAVQVYQGLDWRRIGSHHNGYIAAAFRGELEIAKHRALDQSKRENVSPAIEQKYRSAVDQKSGPREYSAEEWLAAEEVRRQLREFDAAIAPDASEPRRVSQDVISHQGRGAAFSSQSQDWAQVGGESWYDPQYTEGPSRSDEASRPTSHQEKEHDFRGWMALLVPKVSRMGSGAAVPDLQALVLGWMADARLASVDEGILFEGMLRRSGVVVALRANGARHGPGKEFPWSAITARAG